MRILIATMMIGALVAGCTVEQPVTSISQDSQTYRTKANVGVVGGGADAAEKDAKAKAEKYCAAQNKHATIVGTRAHQVAMRSIVEVSFQCASVPTP